MNANASDEGATISRVIPQKKLDAVLHQRDRQGRFLGAFAECGSVLLAARWAGVHRQSHYWWMKEDPTYPARFEQTRMRAVRQLEDEAVKRARRGLKKPVLYKGKQVYVRGRPYYEHQHSDSLLMFLLRAYDPERFGNRPVIELNLEDWDGDINKLTTAQQTKLLETLNAKLVAQGIEVPEDARPTAIEVSSESVSDSEARAHSASAQQRRAIAMSDASQDGPDDADEETHVSD